jgi:ankyrin repeat protein
MNIRDIVQTITGKKKALGVELWKELFRTGVQADYKAGVNADSKSISIIKGLTDAGADVNLRDSQKRSLLHYISNNEECRAIARILIEAGADVNANRNGSTALMWASNGGHIDIVKLLLDRGSDPNLKDEYSSAALIEASRFGFTEIVKLLLDHRADPNIRDNDGGGGLDMGCQQRTFRYHKAAY